MLVFSKELTDTDVSGWFTFPTRSSQHLHFGEKNFVNLYVKDSSGELRQIRGLKTYGDYHKPKLSKGWLQFVADYNLRVGDKVVLLREDDHHLGSRFRIEAKRKTNSSGEKAWDDVPRAS